jgi:hypothetical protein
MGVDFNPFKFEPSLYPFIPSNTTAAECAQYLNADGYEKDQDK